MKSWVMSHEHNFPAPAFTYLFDVSELAGVAWQVNFSFIKKKSTFHFKDLHYMTVLLSWLSNAHSHTTFNRPHLNHASLYPLNLSKLTFFKTSPSSQKDWNIFFDFLWQCQMKEHLQCSSEKPTRAHFLSRALSRSSSLSVSAAFGTTRVN